MVRRNTYVALRYHKRVIDGILILIWRESRQRPAEKTAALLDGTGQPVGFQLRSDLRHVMPEHDDVMLPAIDITDVVAQQRLGLEAEALEQGDAALLIDRHLHRQLFEIRTQG